jgi:hypothetical protein
MAEDSGNSVKLVIRNVLSGGACRIPDTRIASSQAALVFDFTLIKRRAGKAEMNLDPSGSPRHEQTVAVALKTIIAQSLVQ